MSEDWLYFNQETSRMYGNNKWFQLLCILPPEAIRGDNNNIDRIRFALLNEETLNKTAKKAIFKYIYSNALNYWSIYMERNQLGFFDDPDRIKWPKRIKETTMIAIQKLCRYHNNEQYQLWDAKCKKQYETECKRISREQTRKREFLQSALYQFIEQLTYKEDDIVASSKFYQEYSDFCKTNDLQVVTHNSFGKILGVYGILSFRYKKIRSYRLTKESINNFINYYGVRMINPNKLSPQETQAYKERLEARKQELIKMDKMAAFIYNMASESEDEVPPKGHSKK
jgi:hypothetical protein